MKENTVEVLQRHEGFVEPGIERVTPLADHQLLLEYKTGEKRRLDVRPYLAIESYKSLNDEGYFNQVQLRYERWFVGWPEGQDLAPDDLYELSIPVE